MVSALGVSVGSSATRLAFPRADELAPSSAFDVETISPGQRSLEELAGAAIRDAVDARRATATAIAFRTAQQARAMHGVMARLHLEDYELVHEVRAALTLLGQTSKLPGNAAVALFDLGATGLTVTIADAAARQIHYSARHTQLSATLFDRLIRESQLSAGHLRPPVTDSDDTALDTACQHVKVQLSAATEGTAPTPSGVVTLTRAQFETLIAPAAAAVAEFTATTVANGQQPVHAVAMIGGGSRIPFIQNAIRKASPVPVITVAEPETVIARGAALLAGSAVTTGSLLDEDPLPPEPPPPPAVPDRGKSLVRKIAAAVGLAVISGAVIVSGRTLLPGESAPDAVTSAAVPATTTVAPPPASAPEPSPPPGSQPALVPTPPSARHPLSPAPAAPPAPPLMHPAARQAPSHSR